MNDRRNSGRIFFVLFAFGVVSLLAMLTQPSLASIRAVDIVHLIGTGMCFGGAVVALVMYLRSSPPAWTWSPSEARHTLGTAGVLARWMRRRPACANDVPAAGETPAGPAGGTPAVR